MVQVQHEKIKKELLANLNVARHVAQAHGAIGIAPDRVEWIAVNQASKQKISVSLPRMILRNQWLGKNASPAVSSPVVDEVKSLVGGSCTIFQRMNEAGDMLRVCTNVENAEHQRTIGTYIAAIEPDGKPNPVVSAGPSRRDVLGSGASRQGLVHRRLRTALRQAEGNHRLALRGHETRGSARPARASKTWSSARPAASTSSEARASIKATA